NGTTPNRNLPDLAFHTQDPKQGGAKLLQMSVGLEGKQVRAQKPPEKFLTPGQDWKNFRRREGNVEEKSNRSVGKPIAQHLREQHQMVVVHPDEIIVVVALDDGFAEDVIRLHICVPTLGVKLQLGGEVVKNRPKGLIGIPFVETGCHIFGQVDGEAMLSLGPLVKNNATALLILVATMSGPTDPVPAALVEKGVHCAG